MDLQRDIKSLCRSTPPHRAMITAISVCNQFLEIFYPFVVFTFDS